MTAVPVEWIVPPSQGWTYEQVKDFDLPYDWELMDGVIVPRGLTSYWHDRVRNELYSALRAAQVSPYVAEAERCLMLSEENVLRPDVVVFDKTGLNVFELECLPAASAELAVEVVSHGTRSDDRFRKPALYAEAGVASYWRVERDEDKFPVVHEFRLDRSGAYLFVARHERVLETVVPYEVRIDLSEIMAL